MSDLHFLNFYFYNNQDNSVKYHTISKEFTPLHIAVFSENHETHLCVKYHPKYMKLPPIPLKELFQFNVPIKKIFKIKMKNFKNKRYIFYTNTI